MVCNSILDAMGNTPIIRLRNLPEAGSAEILVKFEGLNVGGSIKTRTALNMILDAEERGLIGPDTVIVEPTSGNQGIGLALVGAVRGYSVKIIMPDSVSEERRKLVKQYGAEVILVHDAGNIGACIEECLELALKMQKELGADLCVGTDPDCDRVGIACMTADGTPRLLNGNQIGCVLLHYILSQKKERGELPENAAAVTTIVSTNMATAIANSFVYSFCKVNRIRAITAEGFFFVAGRFFRVCHIIDAEADDILTRIWNWRTGNGIIFWNKAKPVFFLAGDFENLQFCRCDAGN